jgi:FkbM family methyltransferase
MKQVLKPDTNCVDVGGFKGEIMDEILKRSSEGRHFIFEPVPNHFNFIKQKFAGRANVTVVNAALSDKVGTATFNFVPDYPAYSGFKVRDYPEENVKTQKIEVSTLRLDDFLDKQYKPGLIKIDVEGAEFLVLSGCKNTLINSRPVVIFEYGLGASNYYNTEPEMMFDFFNKEANYQIFLIEDYLKGRPALSQDAFVKQYRERTNYYFVAVAKG